MGFNLLDVAKNTRRDILFTSGIPLEAGHKPSAKRMGHFIDQFFANDPQGAYFSMIKLFGAKEA